MITHVGWAIFVVSAVTAAIRALPILFLAQRNFPILVRNWLVFIPPAILSAIIASEVIQRDQTTSFGLSVGILATAVSLIVCAVTKSLFAAVAVSIIAYFIFQNL